MLLASLKLRSAQATDQRHEYSFSDYWSLRLFTTVIAIVLIAIVGLSNGTGRGISWVISIVGLAKGVESISDMFYGLFQQHERMDLISKSLIWRGLLTLCFATIALSVTSSVMVLSACMLFSWSIVLFIYDMPNARLILAEQGEVGNFYPKWSSTRIRQLTLLTLPLGVSIAVGSLYNNIPRYVIEHQLGTYSLGIFSALAYFMIFGGMIFTALAQSVIPRLARYHAEGNIVQFRKILLKLILMGAAIGVAGVVIAALFGRKVLVLFYSEKYSENTGLLVLLMVANLVDFTFLSIASAVNAMRHFQIQVVIATVSTLVMIPMCVILTHKLGLSGAALSMIAAKSVEALMYVFIAKKYLIPKLLKR